MPILLRSGQIHEQAEELLPWYATGQLDAEDRELVERHLSSCASCRRQLALDRRLAEEFQALAPEVDSGWTLLRQRIESEARPRWHFARGLRDCWAMLRRPAVATVAAAQLAVVIAAGVIVYSFTQPDYRGLGSADDAPAANILVMFRADATEQDIRESLQASGASLVGGPTAADAYLLHVPAGKRPSALARLRSDTDIAMAEPIDGAAQ